MKVILTKLRDFINEQLSRLRLYLHINKQSKTNNSKSQSLKLGLLPLISLIVAVIIILIVGVILLEPWVKTTFFEVKPTVMQPVNKEAEIPKNEVITVQTIFDIKSYVELAEPTQNPNKAGSVNIRESVCDDNIIGSSNWKAIGQVIEGPITKECLGGKWNWYKIKWSNGTMGWSIDNYFQKIEAIRKFSSDGVELEYPFDWQLIESRDSKGLLSQILFQKANSKLVFNTVSTSSLIGTIENNQPACIGQLTDITTKKEFYRASFGYHEIGEKKEKTNYYKYINKSEFFTRQNPSFEVLYNKYLTKTWDSLSKSDTNKMPYIDLFDIQGCSKTITPSYGNINISGTSQLIYIDLQTKPDLPASQIIEEADKIVLSLKLLDT